MNEEIIKITPEKIDMKSLKKIILLRYLMMFPTLGLMFFLPAWSLKYWEGWLYIVVLTVPMAFFGIYLYRNDPGLLERRMKTKEKRKNQRLIIKLSVIVYPFMFILPGFDKRLGWSEVPVFLELISFVLVFIGYLMFVSVLKANSYASRVVEVDENQRVISSGPYALVRHPMYSSLIVLYLFSPIALGSYWAVIPAVCALLMLIPRILDEEKELLENLEGYREYTEKVKFRIVPYLW